MGHQVIECANCGALVMEGHNDWNCDECGYKYRYIEHRGKWMWVSATHYNEMLETKKSGSTQKSEEDDLWAILFPW